MSLKHPAYFYPCTVREMLEFLLPGKKYIRIERAADYKGRRVEEVIRFRSSGEGDAPALITFYDGTFAFIKNGDPGTDLRIFSRLAHPVIDFVNAGLLDEDKLNEHAAQQEKLAEEADEAFLRPCVCGARPVIRNFEKTSTVECSRPACGRFASDTSFEDTEETLIRRIRKVTDQWNRQTKK